MRNPKKLGKNLLVLGIVLIIISIPNFIIANQKQAEAEVIRQTNELRAQVHEDSANFSRTLAYIMLAGGVISSICGLVTSRRN